jgi:uncharacterized protein (DUF697 family)
MEEKEAQAHDIAMKHVWWSAGMGLIPIPIVDWAAITATQLKMLKNLADHYEVEFSEHRGKSVIGALVGGSLPGLTGSTAKSLLKFIPGIGGLVGMVVAPALAGASTYALGKVFIMHFESGGTLLDFDPEKVRAHFADEFEKGKEVVSEEGGTVSNRRTKGKQSPRTA